jgi:hypothetical protein
LVELLNLVLKFNLPDRRAVAVGVKGLVVVIGQPT